MAHEIDFSVKKEGAAWSNKTMSWHKHGVYFETNDSEEIIKHAGLDFQVEKRQLYTNYNGVYSSVDNGYATVRTDTNKPLGVVKSRYSVIQNSEAFKFFDSVIGKDDIKYETAGALKNGKTIYVTAKLKNEMLVNGKDAHNLYLVFTNSHDGLYPVKVFFSTVRVVCHNTLSAALGQTTNSYSVKHTSNFQIKLEEAKRVLNISRSVFDAQQFELEALSKQYVTDVEVKDLYLKLLCDNAELETLGTGADVEEVLSTRKFNIYNSLLNSYFTPDSQQDIIGTKYGVLNGLTYFTSNIKDNNNDEKSVNNHLFGSSVYLQQKLVSML